MTRNRQHNSRLAAMPEFTAKHSKIYTVHDMLTGEILYVSALDKITSLIGTETSYSWAQEKDYAKRLYTMQDDIEIELENIRSRLDAVLEAKAILARLIPPS